MLTTPFIIHDENSHLTSNASKPNINLLAKNKGLGNHTGKIGSSPKKLAIRNDKSFTSKPVRRALGSVTSNDLNIRIANKSVDSITNTQSKNSILIPSENSSISQSNKISASLLFPIKSNNISNDDFHEDDMLCTRKPGKSITTLDPYDYYIETSNAELERIKQTKHLSNKNSYESDSLDVPHINSNNYNKEIDDFCGSLDNNIYNDFMVANNMNNIMYPDDLSLNIPDLLAVSLSELPDLIIPEENDNISDNVEHNQLSNLEAVVISDNENQHNIATSLNITDQEA